MAVVLLAGEFRFRRVHGSADHPEDSRCSRADESPIEFKLENLSPDSTEK